MKPKPTYAVDEYRWGLVSNKTINRRNEWADRVHKTKPTPLKECSQCGGYAVRSCKH